MTDVDMLIDGEAVSQVPATDRGLHYGDGLFETIAVLDGQPVLWPEHHARLVDGCARLGLPAPAADILEAEIGALSRGHARAVVKVVVTRGSGGRGYAPPPEPVPMRLVARYPWPEYPTEWLEQGVRVRTCRTRLGCNPALAGIKHLNRLEHVLARAEWDDPDIAEGLMCDSAGNVIEGTMSNVFCVHGGVLRTPQLSRCGVAGIMRAQLLQFAEAAGVVVEQTDLSLAAIAGADEVLLCNSLIGAWRVRELDGRSLAPGPVAQALAERLRARWPL
ncbi:MAG TPA: aminodeoxychorismate lyase [Gammaproteobacteria bacterium]|nr:aminodeoxychorismate lyase [Gammaproteobacteria bacterium]